MPGTRKRQGRAKRRPPVQTLVMDLEEALVRDTFRARAMLQEIFGEPVDAGEELYAEFE